MFGKVENFYVWQSAMRTSTVRRTTALFQVSVLATVWCNAKFDKHAFEIFEIPAVLAVFLGSIERIHKVRAACWQTSHMSTQCSTISSPDRVCARDRCRFSGNFSKYREISRKSCSGSPVHPSAGGGGGPGQPPHDFLEILKCLEKLPENRRAAQTRSGGRK